MLWRKNGNESSALLVLVVVLAGPSSCLGVGGGSRNVLKAIYLASAFSVRFQEAPGVRYGTLGTLPTIP